MEKVVDNYWCAKTELYLRCVRRDSFYYCDVHQPKTSKKRTVSDAKELSPPPPFSHFEVGTIN